jgi:four helix bundle protein
MNNSEFSEKLRQRTKQMALQVIRFTQTLPKIDEAYVIRRQLIKSATSVAANYRAATRARSGAEFYSKLCVVVEEADETLFWLELLEEAKLSLIESIQPIKSEVNELLAIMAKARKNFKLKNSSPQ